MTIEHLLAKRDGGTNAIENLRLACYHCNHSRHNCI
jgi:5-methylcytosine-specific restriction endonuclease McrA